MSVFLTENEMNDGFVNLVDYMARLTYAIDSAPAAIEGVQIILVDTGGGPVNITLPDPATASDKYSPIIINIGAGTVTITATINGVVNPTISTLFAGMDIGIENNTYKTATRVTP